MIFLLIIVFGSLFLLMYLESPNRRDDSEIKALVKESIERERHPPRNRAFRYAQIGWRAQK